LHDMDQDDMEVETTGDGVRKRSTRGESCIAHIIKYVADRVDSSCSCPSPASANLSRIGLDRFAMNEQPAINVAREEGNV
jgi:hypothetical protein